MVGWNSMAWCCLLWIYSVYSAWAVQPSTAQERIVRGVVREAVTREPLTGVSVYVKGTAIGTVTDDAGRYQLSVPQSNDVLVFSFTGKKTIEQIIGTSTEINIAMEDDETMLEEVYVGYMTNVKQT